MGLRERIERELRAALEQAETDGAAHINIAGRVNKVVVRNVGGGTAEASAEQTAPIVQGPAGPRREPAAEPETEGDAPSESQRQGRRGP